MNSWQARFPFCEVMLGQQPIFGFVDVKTFQPMTNEGNDGLTGNAVLFQCDAAPGDFEAGVLSVDFGQRRILATVPGGTTPTEGHHRQHALAVYHPHLTGMLLALSDGTQGIRAGVIAKDRPRAPNGFGQTKRAGWTQDTEHLVVTTLLLQGIQHPDHPFDVG